MTANELLRPNNYDLYSKSLKCNLVESSERAPEVQVSGCALSLTLSGANSTNGTARYTLVEKGISVYVSNNNGIASIIKKGFSNFLNDDPGSDFDSSTIKLDLDDATTLYLLKVSDTAEFQSSGGVYFPHGTFPLAPSSSSQIYYGTVYMNIPLRQDTTVQHLVPLNAKVVTNDSNGQYIEIQIPHTYDFVSGGTYVTQCFTGTPPNSNSLLPFVLSYPVDQ